MGDWSLMEGQRVATGGMVYGSTAGTTVTAHANANTKGAWVEIYTSTPFAATGILVWLLDFSGVQHLIDIGVGAANFEVVHIPNIHISQRSTSIVAPFYFPITIPVATRIAARMQSSTGSSTSQVVVTILASGFMPTESLGRVTAYGADLTDSGGMLVDPGGVTHTKGAYSQINAATTDPIRAVVVAIGNRANADMTSGAWLADVAIGAAGSETIIIPDMMLKASGTTDCIIPAVIGPIFIDIPAGTRLAARTQANLTDATDRLFDIVLYGID